MGKTILPIQKAQLGEISVQYKRFPEMVLFLFFSHTLYYTLINIKNIWCKIYPYIFKTVSSRDYL